MNNVKSTTARLRRTFQYPEDSTDSQPEALDEQEQEDLITRLAAENAARDAQFRLILLALPLLTTIPYIPSLFRIRTFSLALLSLTSLLSTAYLLHRLPPGLSGIAILDNWPRPKTPHPSRRNSPRSRLGQDDDDEDEYESDDVVVSRRARRAPRRSSFSYQERRSPLEAYLPYLNLGLGVVLALLGWVVSGNELVWTGMGYLPLLVYLVVLAADIVMASVDPEKELSALKYDYKGA